MTKNKNSVISSNSRQDTKSSDGISNLNKQISEEASSEKKPTDKYITKKGTSDFIIKSKDLIEKMEIKTSPLRDHGTMNKTPVNKLSNVYTKPSKLTEINKQGNQHQSYSDLKKQVTPLGSSSAKSKPVLTSVFPSNKNIGKGSINSTNSSNTVGTTNTNKSSGQGLMTNQSKTKINFIPPNTANPILRTTTHNNLQNQILNVILFFFINEFIYIITFTFTILFN